MYLDYYHFMREPFQITPDPGLTYLSPSHKEALASIIYGVKESRGFMAVFGEVGVGKTTILRCLMKELDEQTYKSIYIFNPNLSLKGLLRIIYKELDIQTTTDDVSEMIDRLAEVLIEEYRSGRKVVLIIDEAQNIPADTLESLRMLSNLETSTHKLIQVVMVGQPEFEEMLNFHKLRQLKQRIAIRSTIYPLGRKESKSYINHRLAKTLASASPVFTKGALNLIIKEARGIPRVLNILCNNALITGYGYQRKPVTSRIVREIINDYNGRKTTRVLRPVFALVSLLLLIAGFTWMGRDVIRDIPVNLKTGSISAQSLAETFGTELVKNEEKREEQADTDAKAKTTGPVVVVVKKGDSLSELTKKVYGMTDRYRLVQLVKKHNPHITDSDQLAVGDRIIFPDAGDSL
jgi:general secretion pathway protein A